MIPSIHVLWGTLLPSRAGIRAQLIDETRAIVHPITNADLRRFLKKRGYCNDTSDAEPVSEFASSIQTSDRCFRHRLTPPSRPPPRRARCSSGR